MQKKYHHDEVSVEVSLILPVSVSFRIPFWLRLLLGVFVVVFGVMAVLYTNIKQHPEFAASVADDFLRPVVGTQATLHIESFFFALEDEINQIKYRIGKPKTKAFAEAEEAPLVVLATPSAHFSLDPVSSSAYGTVLPGQGQWTSLLTATDEGILLAKTTLQPDPERSYAVVTLVKMNMEKLGLGLVAGTKEPGGMHKEGPGMVPLGVQQSGSLVASFNGGFQGRDGNYGMKVGSMEYLPMQKGLGTLGIGMDGSLRIFQYEQKEEEENVLALRQNGPLLIKDSTVVASSSAWSMQTWGLTTTNSMYTWRSGAGITKEGDMIYAAGSSLVPETLAKALAAAGCVNAMQLDINQTWVRFILFSALGNGSYSFSPLLPTMVNGGNEYLHGYHRDFFYVYRK